MSRVQEETNRGNLDEFCPTYLIPRWANRPEDAGESWAVGRRFGSTQHNLRLCANCVSSPFSTRLKGPLF